MSTTLTVTFPSVADCLELGEIALEEDHASFQGRVVDSQGQPIATTIVQLHEWKLDRGAMGWHWRQPEFNITNEDGEFPRPTLPGPGQFALVAIHGDSLASLPLPWSPGDEQVELVLGPASEVTGQVLLPQGAPSQGLQVRAVECSDGSERVVAGFVKADGTFKLRGVTGESIALELAAQGVVAPLARIEGITIGAGQQDPRIAPWDLGGELQWRTLHVVDESGEPVKRFTVRTQGKRIFGKEGVASFFVRNGPDLLTVNSSSFREFSCSVPDLPEVVTLRRGYEVDLVIEAGTETAAVLDSLVVSLDRFPRPSAEEQEQLTGDTWTREASKQARTSRVPITPGEPVRLVCHQPGEYRLLFREETGQATSHNIDPTTLPESLQNARVVLEDVDGVQTFRFEWP